MSADRLTRPGDRVKAWIRRAAWLAAGLLLLAPLVAMQFSDAVNWGRGDFLVAGLLLLIVCGGLELALRGPADCAYRAAAVTALLGGLLQAWANLAVGIVGAPGNPANVFFFALPALMLAGALAVRGPARWLAAIVFVGAALQVLGGLVLARAALFSLVFCLGIALVWLLSAALFARAAGRA